jgi:PAS domain S-box-containing protein
VSEESKKEETVFSKNTDMLTGNGQSSADRMCEDYVQRLVENLPGAVYVADASPGGPFQYVSSSIRNLWGHTTDASNEDLNAWWGLIHPEDRPGVTARFDRCRENLEPFDVEYRVVTPDGAVLWMHDTAAPTKIPGGGPPMYVGMIVEITRHKAAARALVDQVYFLETLFDTIPGPMFYKDSNGIYLGCNRAFEEFVKLRKTDIIGKTVHQIWPSDLADQYYAMDKALFKQEGVQVYEAEIQDASGSRRKVVFNKAVFRDSDNRVAGLVGIMSDVTGQRQTEQALEKARKDLETRVLQRTFQLAKANDDMAQEVRRRDEVEKALVKSSEELKLFAYSIVHDLKSPTVGIHGLARNLKERYQGVLDERGHKHIDHILRASETVAALVENINTFIASKDAPLKVEAVVVNDIWDRVKDEFFTPLKRRGIEWRVPDQKITVRADTMSLLRVFQNLVDNALKYGGERLSRIEIGYRLEESYHVFCVSDDGEGIKGSDSKKLFGLFQRDESSLGLAGAGLGLAIVREIARRHGGEVWLTDLTDGQTTFCISLDRNFST